MDAVGLPPCGGSGLKCAMQQKHQKKRTSPSMRREWIEIPDRRYSLHNADSLPPCGGSGLKLLLLLVVSIFCMVSLHAEGVD